MRASDRDLIREGHYGQRSCEPRKQAEHMAAPTNSANVKISLANSEPSTHGTKRTSRCAQSMSAFGGKADIVRRSDHTFKNSERIYEGGLSANLFNRISNPAVNDWPLV